MGKSGKETKLLFAGLGRDRSRFLSAGDAALDCWQKISRGSFYVTTMALRGIC